MEDIVVAGSNGLPIWHVQPIGKIDLVIELAMIVLPGFTHEGRRRNDITIFALSSGLFIDVVQNVILKRQGELANRRSADLFRGSVNSLQPG